MAGITHILWIYLLLIFNNIAFTSCSEATESPESVYIDSDFAPQDPAFLPPTPYLPNNGEYVYANYEVKYPFPDDIPCDQRRRCEKRNLDYDLDLKDKNCFCDAQCVAYADCCVDYEPMERSRSLSRVLDSGAIACGVVREIDPNNAILLVESCPRDLDDDYLHDQCDNYYPEDGFLNLPVSGNTTGILYKNVYCAICSGDTSVDFWTVEYQCLDSPSSPVNQLDANAALDQTLDNPQGCTRNYRHDRHTIRYCKPDIISRCHRDWTDKRVKRRCKSDRDTSYVYYAQNRIFKNVYCAICNNLNESLTTCRDDVTEQLNGHIDHGHFPLGTPFSVILDLNKGSAGVSVKDMVDVSGIYEKTEIVVDLRQCPEHHVYDPFARMCRLIGCSTGRTFYDGLCVSDSDQHTPTSPHIRHKVGSKHQHNATTVNHESTVDPFAMATPIPTRYTNGEKMASEQLVCPKTSYAHSEYTLLQNGSAEIGNTRQIYDESEFDIGQFGEIYVCLQSIDTFNNSTYNETDIIMMFQFNSIQNLVSIICLLISIVSLVTVFVVYIMLPQLRTLQGKCIICLTVVLFCAHLLFLVGTHQTKIELVCQIIGAALHYFFLATFFWMNVLALDICVTFTSKTIPNAGCCRFACYSLYAWLTPALIVGGSVALDVVAMVPEAYKPHYATDLCWITRRDAMFYLFALPIAIILIINLILFAITIIAICAFTGASKMAERKRKQIGTFVVYVILGLIMGLAWVSGFVATLTDYNVLWYVFTALTGLQGLFICIAFVCTRKVCVLIADRGKPARRKGATVGGYYAGANGSTNGTIPRHTGSYDQALTLELQSHETTI